MRERGQILVLTGSRPSGTLATVHDALPVSAVIAKTIGRAFGDHDDPNGQTCR